MDRLQVPRHEVRASGRAVGFVQSGIFIAHARPASVFAFV